MSPKRKEKSSEAGTKKIWGISLTFKRVIIIALLFLVFIDLFGYYILLACGVTATPYSVLEHMIKLFIPGGGAW